MMPNHAAGLWSAGLAAGALLLSLSSANAQNPAQGRVPPDVQVVVAPLQTGQWAVTEVYPRQTPRAQAELRMKALLAEGGWSAVGGVQFEDRSLGLARLDGKRIDRLRGEDQEAPADTVMSSVSCVVSGGIVDVGHGSMNLTPFARSLHDLSRISIVYLVPPTLDFRFRGLEHFDDGRVRADIAAGQGTYVYTLNITDHGVNALTLPSTQAADSVPAPSTMQVRRPNVLATGMIIAFALGAGVLVYVWATRLSAASDRA